MRAARITAEKLSNDNKQDTKQKFVPATEWTNFVALRVKSGITARGRWWTYDGNRALGHGSYQFFSSNLVFILTILTISSLSELQTFLDKPLQNTCNSKLDISRKNRQHFETTSEQYLFTAAVLNNRSSLSELSRENSSFFNQPSFSRLLFSATDCCFQLPAIIMLWVSKHI